MKIIQIVFLAGLLLISASCAFHSGTYSSNAHLEPGKFQVLGFASGTAKTTHILGIGGLDQNALVQQARADLYKNYVLDSAEVFANVSVDFKRSYYFVVATTLVTVTADVVRTGEFTNSIQQNIFKSKAIESDSEGFKVTDGRNIAFINNNRLLIGTIKNTNYVDRIVVKSMSGRFHKVLKNDLYFTDGEMPATIKIKPGDKVNVKSGGLNEAGTVLGVNDQNTLVELPGQIITISNEELIRQNQK